MLKAFDLTGLRVRGFTGMWGCADLGIKVYENTQRPPPPNIEGSGIH